MTTIAAIQGSTWAVVGYDSQVSEDNGRKYTLPKDSGKCFAVGEYLIGVAGDLRAVNILSYIFRPPDPAGKNSVIELDKFMNSKFVPALKRCFDENYYGKDGEHGSELLVVVNSTIYEIGGNYDCMRDTNGLYAIGSGGDYALGALSAQDLGARRTIKVSQDSIHTAITIASKYDAATSDPITTITKK